MRKDLLKFNLQYFAEGNAEGENTEGNTEGTQGKPEGNKEGIDYEKLASLIDGKQKVTEDTVLKSFFKEQGLTGDEMKQAINAFKEQKAKNTPNVSELNEQIKRANTTATKAKLDKEATLQALTLGVELKKISHLVKMADLSKAVDSDGNISSDAVKTALEEVLKDIPELKANSNGGAGIRVGAGSDGENEGKPTELDRVRKLYGLK